MFIDNIIIIIYLFFTMLYALYVGREFKNFEDYALGGRNFSTPILAATIFATYASSSAFYIDITESYANGGGSFFSTLGQNISLIFSGYFIGSRMKEFFGCLSISEIFGKIYGGEARVISSISIFILTSGFVAMQIKVISTTLNGFLNIGSFECTIITALVFTIYSAFGGIRAVTFTDFLQFITIALIIPLIIMIIWNQNGTQYNINNQEELVFEHLLNIDDKKIGYYSIIFIYCLVPTLSPPVFQRMLMAKDTSQIKNSFLIASILMLIFTMFATLIGSLIYISNPNLGPGDIFEFFINNYTSPGGRGFLIIGIIAMAISTADSHLNSASVSFSHDFCKPIGLFPKISKINLSKIFTLVIGCISTIIALNFNNILDLLLLVYSFYGPIITVPLLLAIFGFRTSKKAIFIGMITGLIFILINFLMADDFFDLNVSSFVFGMSGNLLAIFTAHYIFKEKGGWRQGPGSGLFNSQKG